MKQISLMIVLALVLTACGARATTTPTDQAVTAVPSTNAEAPATHGVVVTNVPAPAAPGAINTPAPAPSSNATEPAATVAGSSTAVITSTAKPRPRPTATSAGPLTFIGMGIYVANCQLAPTADKPGKVIVQISIEVAGGNGVYQYFDNDGVTWPTKFIDVPGDRGTPLLGRVKVTSGDGQSITKVYDISPGELTCS